MTYTWKFLLDKSFSNPVIYRIAGKFGGELNLAVWRIDQPTAKLKSANIKSFLDFARAKAIAHCEVTWWVWSLG